MTALEALINELVAFVDTDENNQITYEGEEGKDTDHKLTDDDLLTKLRAYDANGDGVIDIEEFKNKGKDKVFGPIIDSLAVFVDTDENNQISFQEYKASYLWV